MNSMDREFLSSKLTGFQYEIYKAILKGNATLFIDLGGLDRMDLDFAIDDVGNTPL